MKKMIMNYVAAAAASFLLAGNATAGIILVDVQDGTSGNEYADWFSAAFGNVGLPTGHNLAVNATTGGTITMDTDLGDLNPYGALYYTTGFGNVNLTAIGGEIGPALTFYFDANGGSAPSGLGFYFQSGFGTTDSHWFYDIASVGSANTYEVSLAYASGWDGYGDRLWDTGTGTSFSQALTDVSAIGMFVYFNDVTAAQSYNFANVGYGETLVPEPETYMVLGMALLTVAFVFRKRITESLEEARAMMQA